MTIYKDRITTRRAYRKTARVLLEAGERVVPLIKNRDGRWVPQRKGIYTADYPERLQWVEDSGVHWSGLAIVTAGLVVIDLDTKNGGTPGQLIDVPELDHAPQILTPSDGVHYYLKLPLGLDVRSRLGWRPGIDLKAGDHSLVFTPPTPGYTGTFPSRDIIPAAPQQVLASLEQSVSLPRRGGVDESEEPDELWKEIWRGSTIFSTTGCENTLRAQCVEIREAAAGSQRTTLLRIGLRTGRAIAKGGLSIGTAWPKLLSAALQMTIYDSAWAWTEREIEAVLKWAICQGWANQGGWDGVAPRHRKARPKIPHTPPRQTTKVRCRIDAAL